MKKQYFLAIYLLVSIIFVLLCIEGIMRLGFFQPTLSSRQLIPYDLLFDTKVLFKPKPHSGKEINNFGYRDRDFTRASEGKKRVLFYGDSFVMALNVPIDQTMPRQLEKRLGAGHQVYNMGVSGYGPDQSLMQYTYEGEQFGPEAVVLCIYPTNDYQDINMNNLVYLDNQDHLYFNDHNPVAEAVPRLKLAYLYQYLLLKYVPGQSRLEALFPILFRRAWDYDFLLHPDSELSKLKKDFMRVIVREFNRKVTASGKKFLVVVMPNISNMERSEIYLQNGVPRERFFLLEDTTERILSEERIPFISLYHEFQRNGAGRSFFDQQDFHLNAAGYAYAAHLVARYLQTH